MGKKYLGWQLLATLLLAAATAAPLFAVDPQVTNVQEQRIADSTPDAAEQGPAAAPARAQRSSSNTITVVLPGGVPLELVWIPQGTFMMGSPTDERGRNGDENLHQVTLTQGYYLGKYEVTQEQWQAVMGGNPGWDRGVGDHYPVYYVSWDAICGGSTGSDCTSTSFIGKLNASLSTTKFRLPTEAEWERAARGGTTTPFSFPTPPEWDKGCGPFPEAEPYMWWCGNNSYMSQAVGQKKPNPYGLYDIHGNVREWVGDWYGNYPSGAIPDPTGPSSGSRRVLRSCGWDSAARICRSAYRYSDGPGESLYDYSFRLAMSADSGEMPSASYTFAPSSPQVGQSVQFTDTSTGSPTSWSWSFGDSSTSTQQNPTHTYSTSGSKSVTLTAANGSGSDSATQVVSVSDCAAVTSAPTLTATAVSSTSITLFWSSVASATTYKLYRDSTMIYEGSGLTYTDAALSPDAQYCYTVRGSACSDGPLSVQRCATTPSGSTATIAEVMPDTIPRGSGCDVRLRLRGPHLDTASDAYLITGTHTQTLTITDIWGSTNDTWVVVQGHVPPTWPVGESTLRLVTNDGPAEISVEVFDRGAPPTVGGPYAWVLGTDLVKAATTQEQIEAADNLVQSTELNPLGVHDLLVHVTENLSLENHAALFEELLRKAHMLGMPMRIHAWVVDYQGSGGSPRAFSPGEIKAKVRQVLDWNNSHFWPERFDGVHLNIESPIGGGGDSFIVSQLFADLDLMVGDLVLSESPEFISTESGSDYRDRLGLDFCNLTQYVDILMPQLYIVGKCDEATTNGRPDCITFDTVNGYMKHELEKQVDRAASIVPGLAVVDSAVLQRPSNPAAGCTQSPQYVRVGYHEYQRSASLPASEDNPEVACRDLSLTTLGAPARACAKDFGETTGLSAKWFPASRVSCFPGSEPAQTDWITVYERNFIPTLENGSLRGYEAAAYWEWEALTSGTVTGSTVFTTSGSGTIPTQGAENLIVSVLANLVSGGKAGQNNLGACSVSATISDALGTVLASVEIPLGEVVHIPVSATGESRLDINFSTDCGGAVDVTYTVDRDRTRAPFFLPNQPDSLLVPAAAHIPGQFGTLWKTDLRAFNPGDEALHIEIDFLAEGQDNSGPIPGVVFTLAPKATMVIDDLLNVIPGLGSNPNKGALGIHFSGGGGAIPVITSRTYNETTTGTYGQYVPAMPVPTGESGPFTLAGLRQNDSYRSNVGLANLTSTPIAALTVHVIDETGLEVGSYVQSLPPLGNVQVVNVPRMAGVDGNLDLFTVRVDAGGKQVAAYASVVDNLTGDPVYFEPGGQESGLVFLPGIAHLPGANGSVWRTDIDLFNPGSVAMEGHLEYVPDEVGGVEYRVTVPLAPGEVYGFQDFLGWLLGDNTTSKGYLILSGIDAAATPQVVVRTYNLTADGTYGQSIPSFANSELTRAGETSYIAGVSNSNDPRRGFRTNLGLVNAGAGESSMRITIYGTDGTVLGSIPDYELARGQFVQFNLFEAAGLSQSSADASVGIDVLSGGPVAAYASIIDNRTGDPILVPGVPRSTDSASSSVDFAWEPIRPEKGDRVTFVVEGDVSQSLAWDFGASNCNGDASTQECGAWGWCSPYDWYFASAGTRTVTLWLQNGGSVRHTITVNNSGSCSRSD